MNSGKSKDKDYSQEHKKPKQNTMNVKIDEFIDCAEYVEEDAISLEGLRRSYKEDESKRAGHVAELLVLAGSLAPLDEMDMMHPQNEGISALNIQKSLVNFTNCLHSLRDALVQATSLQGQLCEEIDRIKDDMEKYEKSRKQALGIAVAD